MKCSGKKVLRAGIRSTDCGWSRSGGGYAKLAVTYMLLTNAEIPPRSFVEYLSVVLPHLKVIQIGLIC